MAVYMKINAIFCALPFHRILTDDGSYGEYSFGSYGEYGSYGSGSHGEYSFGSYESRDTSPSPTNAPPSPTGSPTAEPLVITIRMQLTFEKELNEDEKKKTSVAIEESVAAKGNFSSGYVVATMILSTPLSSPATRHLLNSVYEYDTSVVITIPAAELPEGFTSTNSLEELAAETLEAVVRVNEGNPPTTSGFVKEGCFASLGDGCMADNEEWEDSKGDGCETWEGYACSLLYTGYTETDRTELRTNCPLTCGYNIKVPGDECKSTCEVCDEEGAAAWFIDGSYQEGSANCADTKPCEACYHPDISECKDNPDFTDVLGYSCTQWEGYSCEPFMHTADAPESPEQPDELPFNYNQTHVDTLRENCPVTCKAPYPGCQTAEWVPPTGPTAEPTDPATEETPEPNNPVDEETAADETTTGKNSATKVSSAFGLLISAVYVAIML
jgi:hypothetical protein